MKILVVDDEGIIREGIAGMLREEGLEEIDQARDGFEALEIMRTKKFDLVLTDILMPEMDGLELIRRAKDEKLCWDFIILSGYAEFQYAKQAISYGVVEYLLKPVDPKELIKVIRNVQTGKNEKLYNRAEELEEAVWKDKLEEREAEKLARQILNLPGNQHPQSQKVRLLLILVVKHEVSSMYLKEEIEKNLFILNDPVARMLLEILNTYLERQAHPLSARAALCCTMREYTVPQISLTWVAEKIFVNPNYLSGVIGHSIGVPFKSFVRLLRVSRAQELLKGTEEKSIKIIGNICGFKNENMFFRTFRDVTKMTPMNYKKEGV